jgi:hypothetical protein
LTFASKEHIYKYNEQEIISVTRWLATFFEPFDPYKISKEVSVNPNSQYYGMDPAVIRGLWSKTSGRGTGKHHTIEKWLNGTQPKCVEMDFLTELGITPETSWAEITLLSVPLMIAGTADIITQNDVDDYTIFDIKTAKSMNEDKLKKYSIQILLYCLLLTHMCEGKCRITPGGIVLISPVSKISEGVTNEFKPAELLKIDESAAETLKYYVKKRRLELK